jgi:hypothetical protein
LLLLLLVVVVVLQIRWVYHQVIEKVNQKMIEVLFQQLS